VVSGWIPLSPIVCVEVSRIAEDGVDPAANGVLLPDEALGVDMEQHGDAVPRQAATCVAGTPALRHVETAACRRS
jgi:hypothetical protein